MFDFENEEINVDDYENYIIELRELLEQKEKEIAELQQNYVHVSSFHRLKSLTDEKIRRLHAAIEFGKTVLERKNTQHIVNLFIEHCSESLNLEKLSIFTKREENDKVILRIDKQRGISPETCGKMTLLPGEGLAGNVFNEMRPMLVPDALNESRFLIRKGHRERAESIMLTPLGDKNSLYGIVCVERSLDRNEQFTLQDLDHFIMLSQFAAAALNNAGVHERMRQKYQILQTLMEVSEAITSTLNLDEVLNLILVNISKIIGVQRCSIMLLNETKEFLTLGAALGIDNIDYSREVPVGEGIAGWVAREGKPVLIQDIEKHPFYKKKSDAEYISKSLLSVPLKYKDNLLGVLNITNKKTQKAFTKIEQKLVTYYAEQVSIAIENAHMYSKVKQMAVVDGLTGLANHRSFQDMLKNTFRISKKSDSIMALSMIDVDDFKKFNDTYGHVHGDTVLREIGTVLLDFSVSHKFFAARYGGEEFAIIFKDISAIKAYEIIEEIRQKIEEHTILGPAGKRMQVTISCGISERIAQDSSVQLLIDRADRAMYRAKNAGKNRTVISS